VSTVEPQVETSESAERSATGLDSNLAGALSYVLGFITGAILLIVETDDAFVRFHAAQSVAVFAGLLAVNVGLTLVSIVVGIAIGGLLGSLVSGLLGLVGLLVGLAGLVAWVGLIVTAYQGKTVRVPVAAGVADRIVA
jgi:uncharacterized membrane protein